MDPRDELVVRLLSRSLAPRKPQVKVFTEQSDDEWEETLKLGYKDDTIPAGDSNSIEADDYDDIILELPDAFKNREIYLKGIFAGVLTAIPPKDGT